MSVFDPAKLRPYSGPSDVMRMMPFAGECNFLTDYCCSLHPGDIGHFLSNALAGRDPAPYCYLYEPEGNLEAVILLHALRSSSWGLLVHPRSRDVALETALIAWAEARLRQLLTEHGSVKEWITSEALECDTLRRDILASRGYATGPDPDLFVTTRPLQGAIPAPELPEGFSIRTVAGEAEADAAQAAHASAFNRAWRPGEYVEVMRSPSYQRERELVVVAPDGRIAAFLVYWIDPISHSGLFEPVGCHADFQRRGLTKALLYEGMRRMAAQGMTQAVVVHEAPDENPASAALYRSVGFTPKYRSHEYRLKRS